MRFTIRRPVVAQLRAQARAAAPRETCALLAGHRRPDRIEVTAAIALRNLEPALDRFRADPLEFARAERDLRRAGLQAVGWFHSHPDAPPEPSRADAADAWPGMLLLIGGRARDGRFALRAFWPAADRLVPVPRAAVQRTMSTSSMSNTSVELPGIDGGLPNSP
jgi:proteasome lid subunit RPN8/RPN11